MNKFRLIISAVFGLVALSSVVIVGNDIVTIGRATETSYTLTLSKDKNKFVADYAENGIATTDSGNDIMYKNESLAEANDVFAEFQYSGTLMFGQMNMAGYIVGINSITITKTDTTLGNDMAIILGTYVLSYKDLILIDFVDNKFVYDATTLGINVNSFYFMNGGDTAFIESIVINYSCSVMPINPYLSAVMNYKSISNGSSLELSITSMQALVLDYMCRDITHLIEISILSGPGRIENGFYVSDGVGKATIQLDVMDADGRNADPYNFEINVT